MRSLCASVNCLLMSESRWEVMFCLSSSVQIWTLDDKQNITSQRLSDINKQLTDAQSERVKKESLYQFAKSGNLDAVPQIQSNLALTELFKKRSEVSSDYTDALNQYGPNFPKVQRLQAQLKDYDQSIEKEKKNILAVLESDYREAQQRESLLTEALDEERFALLCFAIIALQNS